MGAVSARRVDKQWVNVRKIKHRIINTGSKNAGNAKAVGCGSYHQEYLQSSVIYPFAPSLAHDGMPMKTVEVKH